MFVFVFVFFSFRLSESGQSLSIHNPSVEQAKENEKRITRENMSPGLFGFSSFFDGNSNYKIMDMKAIHLPSILV